MSIYKTILLAVDLHPDCDESITQRAAEIAKLHGAALSIIHAVEYINAYGVAQAYPTVIDLEREMLKEAKESLSKLAAKYHIPTDHQVIEVGSPKVVILEYANKIKADLIIMGSHGRHGISLLLGSTANAVLHHAHCDVLAISLRKKES
jgi:universal stress protein A